ncbi:hypothetical protein ABI_47410 [Asticcacaulis biprosthecium C19]|uniref:Uncharacterized protein n=1 Tax=Asticcacaulis biprosthecium C19 TaxID=715226 RepID=F4QU93_9CAUL|nr:hypothetical protein ABI_47410 [Asticcacaulis biprosthecium C19]
MADGQEDLQFVKARHGRRTGMAGDDQGAAGIGPAAAGRQVLAPQPAAQEAGGKSVAGAQDVHDIDRKARHDQAVFDTIGHRAVEDGAAVRPQLADQDGVGRGANGLQGGDDIVAAAQDANLFLSADDQVAQRCHSGQALRDLRIGDIALLAHVARGQSPQDRAVVDIESDLSAGRLDLAHGLQAGGIDARLRQVGAIDDQGTGGRQPGRVDVRHVDGHVGTVFAVEDEREGFLVDNAQQNQGRQPRRIGDHATGVEPFAVQGFQDETAHVIGADAGDQAGLQPQTGGPDSGVGRTATDVLCKGRHIFETAADLLPVQVNTGSPKGDDIQSAGSESVHARILHGTPSRALIGIFILSFRKMQLSFHIVDFILRPEWRRHRQ